MADTDALTLWLLDMGAEQYGDSIVCRRGGRIVLIDGGHPGDFRDRNGFRSIPNQLAEIFKKGPPFDIDLLLVTHCHRDHIGCLPALVKDGTINVETALVADEQWGFGHVDDAVRADASDAVRRLAAALREEDHSDLPADQLDVFLEDAGRLEDQYNDMLQRLATAGTTIVRYGRDDSKSVETRFRDFGLKILGPTRNHLEICARAIASFSDIAADWLRRTGGDASTIDFAALYRAAVAQADAAAAFAPDRPGKGAALNDQSVVIKLDVNGQTALLGGDMQFAKAEVSGLNTEMASLRNTVQQAGPYAFIKTLHHTSYNGLDDSLLDEWEETHAFAHSGGINDATHPDPGALQKLERRKSHLQYARTDRNGLIKVTFPARGVQMTVSRGDLDDFSPNSDVASGPEEPTGGELAGSPARTAATSALSSGTVTEVTATARLGSDVSRLTVTFDIDRSGVREQSSYSLDPGQRRVARQPIRRSLGSVQARLAAARQLPRLLFVTYRPRLENNVGTREAADALNVIASAGQQLLEVRNQNAPFAEIQRALTRDHAGVVIVGGYDVLPPLRLDVLPPSLRQQLGATTSDADNFLVWNDDVYGDQDGDGLPEYPMSRIPDAKSPDLLLAALTAGGQGDASRFGIRNVARPFAEGPFGLLAGNSGLLISEPTLPAAIGLGKATASAIYVMLHGSDIDGTRFWGEDDGGTIEGMNVGNVPKSSSGVAFAGCCWGALTVQTTARLAGSGLPLGVRTPGASIALSYLRAGAPAFVGCTGTHYSPTVAPYRYFGGPMHEAFWTQMNGGAPPARALFEAKLEYLRDMPHGQTSAVAQAIEFKTLKQFTCLGLGW